MIPLMIVPVPGTTCNRVAHEVLARGILPCTTESESQSSTRFVPSSWRRTQKKRKKTDKFGSGFYDQPLENPYKSPSANRLLAGLIDHDSCCLATMSDKAGLLSSPQQVVSDQDLAAFTISGMIQQSSMGTSLVIIFLSLLICLGFANTLFQSQVTAFRTGLHRRLIKPVVKPFRRILWQRREYDTDEESDSDTDDDDENDGDKSTIDTQSSSTTPSITSLSFLNDLSPPFTATGCAVEDLTSHVECPEVTHFCFLLHGHRGLSKDLTYMQVMMQRVAMTQKQQRDSHDMVVHSSVCNEGKTTDGIQNGGERLVQEMREVILQEMIKRHAELLLLLAEEEEEVIITKNADMKTSERQPTTEHTKIYDLTLSILGNSLGGLFGRYAIAKLIERHCVWEAETKCWILDNRFRLHLNTFCTTATPHLGVSRHTYVKIPRTAEIGVAHALGATGKDLFRLNDLLHVMATSPTFLKPLSQFRKRVAYANAYGTDFPVPASTAAFLSENSTYPHYIVETNTTSTSTSTSENGTVTTEIHGGLVIATMYTPTQPEEDHDGQDNDKDDESQVSESLNSRKSGDLEDELDQMSRSLDRLGWKKVFVDIRRELPSAELPKWTRRSSSFDLDDPAAIPHLQSLQLENRVVESREVAAAVTLPTDNRVALPLGHNMIVAFSRSPLSTFMNKGGRPVVDALAKEMVEDIFSWRDSPDK